MSPVRPHNFQSAHRTSSQCWRALAATCPVLPACSSLPLAALLCFSMSRSLCGLMVLRGCLGTDMRHCNAGLAPLPAAFAGQALRL
eukprot:1414338-Rhodomonas_salina.1